MEQVLGRPFTEQPDGVHRFGFPRTDLKVRVDEGPDRTGAGAGLLRRVCSMADHVMAMGDLVLTPVLDDVTRFLDRCTPDEARGRVTC